MKKLMILGAGIYQVPLIKKAREMGLYTIVVSIAGDYPGFAYADKIYYVDTKDPQKIYDIAKEEAVSGICTTGTDVAVPSIGYVCDRLGLPGVSEQSARYASDKDMMKERFVQNDVDTARYRTIKNEDDLKNAIEELNFPLMFKAVDSSGSRGIIKVEKKDEDCIRKAVRTVKEVTGKDYFLIEEFIDGEELGADALICNGEIQFVIPHGKYVFRGDSGVPIGHFMPCGLPRRLEELTREQIKRGILALGLDNCAVNADLICSNGKIYVLEMGARAGATCLPEMISVYFGIDYYKMIIRTALGAEIEKINDAGERTPVAARLIAADKTGVIARIDMPEIFDERLLDLSLDYKVGDHVRKFHIGPDRIGQIITCGDTLQESESLLDDIYKRIEVDIA